MQQDYKGYLVKFGSMALPNAFLTRYVSTPDQRTEKKAWRDNTCAMCIFWITNQEITWF